MGEGDDMDGAQDATADLMSEHRKKQRRGTE